MVIWKLHIKLFYHKREIPSTTRNNKQKLKTVRGTGPAQSNPIFKARISDLENGKQSVNAKSRFTADKGQCVHSGPGNAHKKYHTICEDTETRTQKRVWHKKARSVAFVSAYWWWSISYVFTLSDMMRTMSAVQDLPYDVCVLKQKKHQNVKLPAILWLFWVVLTSS